MFLENSIPSGAGKAINDGRRSLLLLPDGADFSPQGKQIWGNGFGGSTNWHPFRLREGIWLIDARGIGSTDLQFGEAAAVAELQRALLDHRFFYQARMFCRTTAFGMLVPTRALSFPEARRQLTNFLVAALHRHEMAIVGRAANMSGDLLTGSSYPKNSRVAVIRKRDLQRGDQQLGQEITLAGLTQLLPGPEVQNAALDLLGDKENRDPSGNRRTTSTIDAVHRAVRSGDLVLISLPVEARSGGAAPGTTTQQAGPGSTQQAASSAATQQSTAPRRAKVTPKTFIEIVLRYEDTQQPAAGVKYRLQITDGSVREGTLDNEGKARVTGIDPGKCTVTFPDLDSREWHPA